MDQTGMKISVNKGPWSDILGWILDQGTEPVPVNPWWTMYVTMHPELIITSNEAWFSSIPDENRFGYRIKNGEWTAHGLAYLADIQIDQVYGRRSLYTVTAGPIKDRRNGSYITMKRKKA
jgi:hypothetical protein